MRLCELLIKGGEYFFDWVVTGEQRSRFQTQGGSHTMTLGNNQFLYFQKVLFSFKNTMWCPSAVQPVYRIFGLFGLNIVLLNRVCLSSLSWWCSDIIWGQIFELFQCFSFQGSTLQGLPTTRQPGASALPDGLDTSGGNKSTSMTHGDMKSVFN